jgi:putative flavoprotein involved in K+ transport
MSTLERSLDILIIGAGQAGLAAGYYLRQTPYRFQLVESHSRIGESWRQRYDSLVLFTPRTYSALPGRALSGEREGYPTKDELADYLEDYARHFALPVVVSTSVQRLERTAVGFRAYTTDGADVASRAVVIATGGYQQPKIPALARQFAADVAQLSPASYKNPSQIAPGTVLVVGDGATGRQLALELAASHRVVLATGQPREPSPDRLLGKSLFWWMDKFGLLRVSRETALGQRMMRQESFPGPHLRLARLRRQGITVVGRLTQADGRRATFATGERVAIDAVVWATGYKDQTDWVAIPKALDTRGQFVHRRGVSPVPGLFFVGRPWQWT